MKMGTGIVLLCGLLMLVCSVTEAGKKHNKNRRSQQDICKLPPRPGHCRGRFVRWFHNSTSGQCKEFTYGGCGGNGNRFEDHQECAKKCPTPVKAAPSLCQLPEDPGPCRADFPMWYYDSQEGHCKAFGYGGCEGNTNRFDTMELCKETCQKEVEGGTEEGYPEECGNQPPCTKTCSSGFQTDDQGCPICECNTDDEAEAEPEAEAEAEAGHNSNTHGAGCRRLMCFAPCVLGYKKDSRGCETCACNSPSAQKVSPLGAGAPEEISEEEEEEEEVEEAVPESECSPVACQMYCPNGFQKAENGCEVCKCIMVAECSKKKCRRYCEFGFVQDEYGCDTCICHKPPQPDPEPTCLPVTCDDECHQGFELDENGCQTCRCGKDRQLSQCPLLSCDISCEHGLVKGEDGCEQCECTKHPFVNRKCSDVMCMMYCEYGFKKDQHGCEICECETEPQTAAGQVCSPVTCDNYCPNGWDKNQTTGCDICACADPKNMCPQTDCSNHCPHGYTKDKKGCHTCRCARKKKNQFRKGKKQKGGHKEEQEEEKPSTGGCAEVKCKIFCPNGYEKDEMGCSTCNCNTPSEANVAVKPSSKCPARNCPKVCPNGFRRNRKGCFTCKCQKNKKNRGGENKKIKSDLEEICNLPKVIGRCEGSVDRWFHNKETGKCEIFQYGGCDGNRNNFREEGHCRHMCIERRKATAADKGGKRNRKHKKRHN